MNKYIYKNIFPYKAICVLTSFAIATQGTLTISYAEIKPIETQEKTIDQDAFWAGILSQGQEEWVNLAPYITPNQAVSKGLLNSKFGTFLVYQDLKLKMTANKFINMEAIDIDKTKFFRIWAVPAKTGPEVKLAIKAQGIPNYALNLQGIENYINASNEFSELRRKIYSFYQGKKFAKAFSLKISGPQKQDKEQQDKIDAALYLYGDMLYDYEKTAGGILLPDTDGGYNMPTHSNLLNEILIANAPYSTKIFAILFNLFKGKIGITQLEEEIKQNPMLISQINSFLTSREKTIHSQAVEIMDLITKKPVTAVKFIKLLKRHNMEDVISGTILSLNGLNPSTFLLYLETLSSLQEPMHYKFKARKFTPEQLAEIYNLYKNSAKTKDDFTQEEIAFHIGATTNSNLRDILKALQETDKNMRNLILLGRLCITAMHSKQEKGISQSLSSIASEIGIKKSALINQMLITIAQKDLFHMQSIKPFQGELSKIIHYLFLASDLNSGQLADILNKFAENSPIVFLCIPDINTSTAIRDKIAFDKLNTTALILSSRNNENPMLWRQINEKISKNQFPDYFTAICNIDASLGSLLLNILNKRFQDNKTYKNILSALISDKSLPVNIRLRAGIFLYSNQQGIHSQEAWQEIIRLFTRHKRQLLSALQRPKEYLTQHRYSLNAALQDLLLISHIVIFEKFPSLINIKERKNLFGAIFNSSVKFAPAHIIADSQYNFYLPMIQKLLQYNQGITIPFAIGHNIGHNIIGAWIGAMGNGYQTAANELGCDLFGLSLLKEAGAQNWDTIESSLPSMAIFKGLTQQQNANQYLYNKTLFLLAEKIIKSSNGKPLSQYISLIKRPGEEHSDNQNSAKLYNAPTATKGTNNKPENNQNGKGQIPIPAHNPQQNSASKKPMHTGRRNSKAGLSRRDFLIKTTQTAVFMAISLLAKPTLTQNIQRPRNTQEKENIWSVIKKIKTSIKTLEKNKGATKNKTVVSTRRYILRQFKAIYKRLRYKDAFALASYIGARDTETGMMILKYLSQWLAFGPSELSPSEKAVKKAMDTTRRICLIAEKINDSRKSKKQFLEDMEEIYRDIFLSSHKQTFYKYLRNPFWVFPVVLAHEKMKDLNIEYSLSEVFAFAIKEGYDIAGKKMGQGKFVDFTNSWPIGLDRFSAKKVREKLYKNKWLPRDMENYIRVDKKAKFSNVLSTFPKMHFIPFADSVSEIYPAILAMIAMAKEDEAKLDRFLKKLHISQSQIPKDMHTFLRYLFYNSGIKEEHKIVSLSKRDLISGYELPRIVQNILEKTRGKAVKYKIKGKTIKRSLSTQVRKALTATAIKIAMDSFTQDKNTLDNNLLFSQLKKIIASAYIGLGGTTGIKTTANTFFSEIKQLLPYIPENKRPIIELMASQYENSANDKALLKDIGKELNKNIASILEGILSQSAGKNEIIPAPPQSGLPCAIKGDFIIMPYFSPLLLSLLPKSQIKEELLLTQNSLGIWDPSKKTTVKWQRQNNLISANIKWVEEKEIDPAIEDIYLNNMEILYTIKHPSEPKYIIVATNLQDRITDPDNMEIDDYVLQSIEGLTENPLLQKLILSELRISTYYGWYMGQVKKFNSDRLKKLISDAKKFSSDIRRQITSPGGILLN